MATITTSTSVEISADEMGEMMEAVIADGDDLMLLLATLEKAVATLELKIEKGEDYYADY